MAQLRRSKKRAKKAHRAGTAKTDWEAVAKLLAGALVGTFDGVEEGSDLEFFLESVEEEFDAGPEPGELEEGERRANQVRGVLGVAVRFAQHDVGED